MESSSQIVSEVPSQQKQQKIQKTVLENKTNIFQRLLSSKLGVACILIILLAMVSVIGVLASAAIRNNSKVGQTPTFDNVQFDFFFHCPVSYMLKPFLSNPQFLQYSNKYSTQLNKTFVVAAMTGYKIYPTSVSVPELRVRYCGVARRFNETCDQASFICSNPGPAFDVQSWQQITVLWINNYTKPNQNEQVLNSMDLVQGYNENECFSKNSRDATELCWKTAKPQKLENALIFQPTNKVPLDFSCPTTAQPYDFTFKAISSREAFPISPHVHGLEVEPYYDGNPLGWWDNQGNQGAGFFTKDNGKMQHLKDQAFKDFLSMLNLTGKTKINVYKNPQEPGTLWYHDHSMAVTSFNVRLGLHGFYLIRNKTIQSSLPSGSYQKLIYMYTGVNYQTLQQSCRLSCIVPNSTLCLDCQKGNGAVMALQKSPLEYNTTYRFRILNGDFKNQFDEIRFIYSTCSTTSSSCNIQIPFTVIGTDSYLRKTSVDNVLQVNLAPAERVDILINIDAKLKSIKSTDVIRVIAKKVNAMDKFFLGETELAIFNITGSKGGKKLNITNYKLNVSFTDFRTIPESNIYVRRMRPLFYTSNDEFGINGHVRFHYGASENPRIGTIEDWFMVNVMDESHPIHIHLIQYQAVEVIDLKRRNYTFVSSGITYQVLCSYYWMDFLKVQAFTDMRNGIQNQQLTRIVTFTNNFTNVPALCYFVNYLATTQFYNQFFATFKNQNQKDSMNISGLNVLEPCAGSVCLEYGQSSTSQNFFKYINKTVNLEGQFLPPYKRGWKEVFHVPAFTYVRIRIRWVRPDFPLSLMNPLDPGNNINGCNEKYFHIEESQITSAPGYVYHCHILEHQDKEMMRSIMVHPSGCTNLQPWRQRFESQLCSALENLRLSGNLRI